MLGSCSEDSTSPEQIKNIIGDNSQHESASDRAFARMPQKTAVERLF